MPALESMDVGKKTAARPVEPEIRQTSPRRVREGHERYSAEVSAAIKYYPPVV